MNSRAGKCVCLLVGALLAIATMGHSSDVYGPDLCVVRSPLVSRSVSAWTESPVVVTGCGSRQIAFERNTEQEVHILRVVNLPSGVSTEPTEITVDVVSASTAAATSVQRRLILILDADGPTKWTLRAPGAAKLAASHHTIIVTGQSEVKHSELRISVIRRTWENSTALWRLAQRRYKAVTSYNEVIGANHLRLKVHASEGLPKECRLENATTTVSPIMDAYRRELSHVEGCFHPDFAGLNLRDIHIVDWVSSASSPGLQNVTLHLTVQEPEQNEYRDVTLVLKARTPVRWLLSSAPQLAGSLIVMSDCEVYNNGISALQSLEVRSQRFPDNFALLILEVTSELGPPVSYVKADLATRLELVIGKKGTGLSPVRYSSDNNKMETSAAVASVPSGPNPLSGIPSMEMGVRSLERIKSTQSSARNIIRNPSASVQQALRLLCGPRHMVAVLPRSIADPLGVVGLTLTDRACLGMRNTTHWTIKSHITSCGSTSRSDGKVTTYSNMLHLQLGGVESDDEDMAEGSGQGGFSFGSSLDSARRLSVPLQCYYEPEIPLMGGGFEGADDDNVLDPVEMGGSQMELYHMELYRDKEFRVALQRSGLGAEVAYDDTLYVKTWIDGAPFIRIVAEKCWVSNSSDAFRPSRLILIRNTCPADLSVQIKSKASDNYVAFSFHVSKDYADMGQLFVHCRLGLCSKEPARTQGNLKLCVDQDQYCTRHILKPFLDESISTAQQMLVRGPVRMVTRLAFESAREAIGDVLAGVLKGNGSLPAANAAGSPSSQVIMLGVSTEVAVGIALASFVIGAALTALLWCIHLKTGTPKQIPCVGTMPKSSAPRHVIVGTICPPTPCQATPTPAPPLPAPKHP